jgi:hypothetical protein
MIDIPSEVVRLEEVAVTIERLGREMVYLERLS